MKPRNTTSWAVSLLVSLTLLCSSLMPAKAQLSPGSVSIGPHSSSHSVYLPNTKLVSWGTGSQAFGVTVGELGGANYRMEAWYLAEAYSVHAATPGMEFTPSYVFTNTPLLVLGEGSVIQPSYPGSSGPFSFSFNLAPGGSKNFAFWDDRKYYLWSPITTPLLGAVNGVPDAHDYYGWFTLRRTSAGLVITDSAIAQGGGIIVGTYTQVPEPSTLALCALAAIGLLSHRGKR